VRVVVALSFLLAAGCCATVKHAQTTEPAPAAPSIPVVESPVEIAPKAATAPVAVEAPGTQESPAPPPPVEPLHPAESASPPSLALPKPPATVAAPAIRPAPPKPPAVPVTPRAPAVPVAPRTVAAPAASQPVAAPLDFKSLGTRLRETRAIGVLTKLSLKNQVDDLLAAFRAYHKGQGSATLAELRRSYDMLLFKVLALLQDSDPMLARDIVKSRTAIWGILADPRKFTESNLMAGATP
jgi:hypothetical protein